MLKSTIKWFSQQTTKAKIIIVAAALFLLLFFANTIYSSIQIYKYQVQINELLDANNKAELEVFEEKVSTTKKQVSKGSKALKTKNIKSDEKIQIALQKIINIDSIVRHASDSTKQHIQSEYNKVRNQYRFLNN